MCNCLFHRLIPFVAAGLESSRLFRRQLMVEHERALQLETMRLSQLQLSGKDLTTQSCLDYSMDDLKFPKGRFAFSWFSAYIFINQFDLDSSLVQHSVNVCGIKVLQATPNSNQRIATTFFSMMWTMALQVISTPLTIAVIGRGWQNLYY